MPIGLIMQFEGLRSEKYDAVMQALGLDGPAADWPDGLVSHLAGATPDGWCVIDVWEAQADFDRFFAGRLKPAFDRVGDLPAPRITPLDVHNSHRHGRS